MSEGKEIPNGWIIEKLLNVCDEISAGGDVPKNNFSPNKTDEFQVPIFANGEKNKGLYGYTKIPKIAIPSVTISARGSIGFTEFRSMPFFPIVRLIVLCPSKNVDAQFLKYALDNSKITNTGTTIPQLTVPTVKEIYIPIPPLPEQHRIVAQIEELFSSLDKGIESLKTAQAQLKVYRQAVLKWAFEGKLTNKNVKDGELPVGWLNIELSKITEKAEKVRPKEKNLNEEFIYLDIGGIDNTLNKIVNHKVYQWKDAPSRAQQIVKVGDTLFSTIRTYLKNIAFVDKDIYENQICSSGFSVIRAKENKSISKYLNYYSIFEEFIRPLNDLQKGTSYPAIRSEDVFAQFINLPPTITEQEKIVQEIESRLSVCDKIEESISTSLLQAEALRQSILKKAFEGKLVAQDPNDEPASVLLERINAEREKNKPQRSAKKSRKSN